MHPSSDTEDKMEAVMALLFFEILTRLELEAEAKSSRNIALLVIGRPGKVFRECLLSNMVVFCGGKVVSYFHTVILSY